MTNFSISSSKKRYRKLFPFQLDLNKPEEHEIAEVIVYLKQERSFSKTVREGIRLIWDLRKGRTDVLRELFPWVLEQQDEDEKHALKAPTAEVMLGAEDIFQKHFQRLESLITEQSSLSTGEPRRPRGPSLKPVDDIEIDVKQATNSEDNKSAWNLMIASALQVHGHCNGLPPELIEYGLRTGRIPPGKVDPPKPKGPKKLAGADVIFTPPPTEDDDFD